MGYGGAGCAGPAGNGWAGPWTGVASSPPTPLLRNVAKAERGSECMSVAVCAACRSPQCCWRRWWMIHAVPSTYPTQMSPPPHPHHQQQPSSGSHPAAIRHPAANSRPAPSSHPPSSNTHPVKLRPREQLAVAPAPEDDKVCRAPHRDAAALPGRARQPHRVCWDGTHRLGPVSIGPVQMRHAAALERFGEEGRGVRKRELAGVTVEGQCQV